MSELTKPIEANEIEWRIQRASNGKTTIVPYITNRCVMNRLDAHFTPSGWSSEFREVSGGFICRITTDKCYKEDGASCTKIEPTKGGISDSMKRCAVQFGIGRNLYDYPRVFILEEVKYIDDKYLVRAAVLVSKINDGTFTKKVATL